MSAARTARLDQDRALIDESVDGILADIRCVLREWDANEVLLGLIGSFENCEPGHVAMVAAGALLRLAQGAR